MTDDVHTTARTTSGSAAAGRQNPDGTAADTRNNPYDIPDIRPTGTAVPAVAVYRGTTRHRMSDEHIARIKARHRRERLRVRIAIGVAAVLVIGAVLCGAWWVSFLM